MNKLISYFKEGKGRGLIAMFIFTSIVGLLIWGNFYFHIKDWPKDPSLINSLNRFPTITISDGKVVSPTDANASYPVEISNPELATVLAMNGIVPVLHVQTAISGTPVSLSDGFYLTQDEFAFVSFQEVHETKLAQNFVVTPELIINTFKGVIFWTPIAVALTYFLILWIFYFIIVIISALLAWILRFKLNKGAVWRSASFSVISVLLIDLLTVLVSTFVFQRPFGIDGILQIIICILLVLLIAFGIRKKK